MKVVICEDDINQITKIKDLIEKKIIIENIDAEIILSTRNINDVRKFIYEGNRADCYFLDIELNDSEYNGIMLGQEIRNMDVDANIIYVTNYNSYVSATFKYQIIVTDYIIKDSEDADLRIREALLKSYNVYKKRNESIKSDKLVLKIGEKTEFISCDKIMYIETNPNRKNKLLLHLDSGIKEISGTLKDYEILKPHIFCRCHSSFLVNRDNVASVDEKNKIVNFINGSKCLASRRLLKNLK